MTENRNFKRRVRARAAKTGESYTTALMYLRDAKENDAPSQSKSLRLAVAQSSFFDDPRDAAALRVVGEEIRNLMRQAHWAGARVVHFPEGATCFPNKRVMSATGPREIGPSDWRRFEWAVLREELDATRRLARELGLWTVFGSVHQLTEPHRPHNSLYVISDKGAVATRYDERMLSNTKISFMYTPGSIPVTFEVDGVRFGCALGIECHFPELFIEYERLNVDCLLFSTTGGSLPNDLAFAAEVQGHASSNRYWTSFAVLAQPGLAAPSGIVSPDGQWAARCTVDEPSIAVADIGNDPGDPARPWRRQARGGIYDPHFVDDDPRSNSRDTF
ncbi:MULTISPECIES: carbon-nitrogen hydrolase family protein [unclassified Ensifer]|uniref:carbon-nitrogen hydrolase family protein n=1 Tax=unclassified Ensifer TaxID=2633371 RepID=UPI000812D795|nr:MULTISPECIES: carbon-nitrogen hydrolase family protein [unclassified Ensifer]OCP03441.1 amidohydrolase [Ensifer sp. LC11]OCP03760.1 amidohydrolase [Ensifer sp. LC13]OCP08459.1 amidohydrolase [Ensifer sp. LC14]OCP30231.1 amidohydrolase [Ensifer sp. LC499]